MSFAIIHLTDIHIAGEEDLILGKVETLIATCNEHLKKVEDAVIVVTGDLSYSGEVRQYKLCCSFLETIASNIKVISGNPVKIIAVPGNHDCDFTNAHDKKIRSFLLERIQRNSTEAFDHDLMQEILKPQENYFNCTASLISLTKEDPIVKYIVHDFNIGKVCFLLYNTAWISEHHEKPGNLCMPIKVISDKTINKADLYISLAHHPLHWLHPDNMIAFRSIIRNIADITLWGHEHYADSVREQGEGWTLCSFEGKELQEKSKSDKSAFSIYILDKTMTMLQKKYFLWDRTQYQMKNECTINFHKNSSHGLRILFPNKTMLDELSDYGTLIHHPSKENIFLDDLFIWPDLTRIDLKNDNDSITVSSETEIERFLSVPITLIAGDEATGKTALSKYLYRFYVSRGKCCLLLKGKYLSARSEDNIKSQVEKIFSEQYDYDLLSQFRSLKLDDKILIIDDFDGLIQFNKKYSDVIYYLQNIFGSIVLLTSIDANISYVITQLNASCHGIVLAYRIKHFGNLKRHDLIEKWYSISELDPMEREMLVSNATNTVNNLIEKFSRIVPATPLLVVTVLQTIDSTGKSNITQYSYVYEQLVQKSLTIISCNDQALQNILVSVLSTIAYMMLNEKKRYINSSELVNEVLNYQNKMLLQFNPVDIIAQLSNSGLLVKVEENKYKFKYPYMYYYFSGLYISRNLEQNGVKNIISYMSEHLFVEDYGNIMIFVCHFTNDEYVIDSVLTCALCALDNFDKFDFAKPSALLDSVNEAIDKQMKALYVGNESDVDNQHKKQLEHMDAQGIRDGNVPIPFDENISDEPMEVADIVSAIRIIDVLGQILKNYPGDIEGDKKISIISGITDLAMRIVGLMYLALGATQDEFIKILTEVVREEKPIASKAQISYDVKMMFASLLFSTSCVMIHSVSIAIGSKILLPAIKATTEQYPSDISLKLVLADTGMFSFSENWYSKLINLGKELQKKNLKYAYQTMRFLVARHLRFYHCGINQRNMLCDTYKLSKNKAVLILPE